MCSMGDPCTLRILHPMILVCECFFFVIHRYLPFPFSYSSGFLYTSTGNIYVGSVQISPSLLSGRTLGSCLALCTRGRMEIILLKMCRLDRKRWVRMRNLCRLLTHPLHLERNLMTSSICGGLLEVVDLFLMKTSPNVADFFAALTFFQHLSPALNLVYHCGGNHDAMVVHRSSSPFVAAIFSVVSGASFLCAPDVLRTRNMAQVTNVRVFKTSLVDPFKKMGLKGLFIIHRSATQCPYPDFLGIICRVIDPYLRLRTSTSSLLHCHP